MILPAQRIRGLCLGQPILGLASDEQAMISPFAERQQHERSGTSFGLSACGYDVRIAQDRRLGPGEFLLASTMERFVMPRDVMAQVADKSTWARRGLAVQNTIIEPGWEGWLTLELTNHGSKIIALTAGTPIAQIIFMRLEEPTEQPYEGKYQDQEDRPVEAR